MRLGWRIIGTVAATLGSLNLLLLVGMSVIEVVSPDSVESSGPSPWLVLTPWILVLLAVAGWSFRRAGRAVPNVVDHRVSAMTRSVNHWERSHPMVHAVVLGIVLGTFWSLVLRSAAGGLVGLVFALTMWLMNLVRRERTPATAQPGG